MRISFADMGQNRIRGNDMDDLISRRAAINALDKRFDNVPMELTTEILQLRRDLRERIPSAQPCIIRCKGCRYWWNKHLCKAHSIYGTYDTKESDFCSRAEKREDE